MVPTLVPKFGFNRGATYLTQQTNICNFRKRAIEDQAAEAVRDLALEELELPAGAEAVTSKLIPLLEWSTLGYDKFNDQVRLATRRLDELRGMNVQHLPTASLTLFAWGFT